MREGGWFYFQFSINAYSIARMGVPKMVKNGIYSLFGVWVWENPASCGICRSSHDLPSLTTARICLSNKPILDANRQKKNKNHFRPISEQACALRHAHSKFVSHALILLSSLISESFNV